jgi:hypothetical protein
MAHPGQLFAAVLDTEPVKINLFQRRVELTLRRNQYVHLSSPEGSLICKRIVEGELNTSRHLGFSFASERVPCAHFFDLAGSAIYS